MTRTRHVSNNRLGGARAYAVQDTVHINKGRLPFLRANVTVVPHWPFKLARITIVLLPSVDGLVALTISAGIARPTPAAWQSGDRASRLVDRHALAYRRARRSPESLGAYTV